MDIIEKIIINKKKLNYMAYIQNIYINEYSIV